jgi:mono/diheme cytochrome c family protein
VVVVFRRLFGTSLAKSRRYDLPVREETMNGVSGASACVFGVLLAATLSAQADKGAKVYADQKCATCHSIAGKGNTKGALDDVGSKLATDEIRAWIVDPAGMTAKHKAERKPAMPAKYTSLPKDDLDALVAYMSSLKKK